jgi:hypothetical protein
MQHLTPERIAALADEPATLTERAHLGSCAACVAELAAAQRLMQMAMTDTPAIERPITSWERLGPALTAEGLVRTPASGGVSFSPRATVRTRRMLQAAAGVFLALGGAVVGRASAEWPIGTAGETPLVASVDTNFASTTDAMNAIERASDDVQRAVAYIAMNDTGSTLQGSNAAYLETRLNVLNQTAAAVRAGLFRAPRDPLLNTYYLSTMGVRDLTLRQMGEVVPVSSSRRTTF